MTSLESETLIEIEKIKAKATIAVAILSSIKSEVLTSTSTTIKAHIIEMIERAQATLNNK